MNDTPPTPLSFRLDGRLALVTGSSQGIGAAIARALAAAGADVAIHYAGQSALAEETAVACRASGVRAAAFGGDLARPETPAALHRAVSGALGEPHILVLNAALQFRRPWNSMPDDEVRAQIQANFLASIELIRLCHPAMAAAHWGRVLAIGSVQQARPSPEMAVYAALKSAQANLVRNLASPFGADGITVNNLRVGVIATGRNAAVLADGERRAAWTAQIPAGFIGEPDDCAGAALLLCSEAGRYINGADLPVDGGLTATS